MKKRNGFTLIELLAVIAILAIILLIAVPMILSVINNAKKSAFASSCKMISVINNAKKSAFASSCKMIVSAAEKHYALGLATSTNNTGTYVFTAPVSPQKSASDFVTAKGITAGTVAISATGAVTITNVSDGSYKSSDATCATITAS